MKQISCLLLIILLIGCDKKKESPIPSNAYVMVLGVAQDGGYPQINCQKKCCEKAWQDPSLRKMISCLAIIDPTTNQQWILDATPDIKNQLQLVKNTTGKEEIDGILLTHAHIGHYTGLMHFGKEAIGSSQLPVFVMKRMKKFLENNGPWSQLIDLQNIKLHKITADSTFNLNKNIQITPFLVPHRDEFSETAGYKITINNKSLVFIPDIDKWEKWEVSITEVIEKADYAFLDATFYKDGELDRDMHEIPHPFVEESIELFSTLSEHNKKKIHFIHFNHTNPLLQDGKFAQKTIKDQGYNIAKEGQIMEF